MQIQIQNPNLIRPDEYFWYVIAILLSGALIWVIKYYLNRTEATLEALLEITKRHDTDIEVMQNVQENHQAQISELKEFKDSGLADSIVAKIRAISPPHNGNGHGL